MSEFYDLHKPTREELQEKINKLEKQYKSLQSAFALCNDNNSELQTQLEDLEKELDGCNDALTAG